MSDTIDSHLEPGAVCRIEHTDSEYCGWLVSVVATPPVGVAFRLPNGQMHVAVFGDNRIVESLEKPFHVCLQSGATTLTDFAVAQVGNLIPV